MKMVSKASRENEDVQNMKTTRKQSETTGTNGHETFLGREEMQKQTFPSHIKERATRKRFKGVKARIVSFDVVFN